MKRPTKLILIILLLLTVWICLPAGRFVFSYELLQGPTELQYWDKSKTYNGYTLFGSRNDTAYLIDMTGRIVHTWPTPGGWSPRLIGNGHIIDFNQTFQGTGLSEYNWAGERVWIYHDPRADYMIHHDFIRIFNKKLNAETTLYIARKNISNDQALAAGCDPANGPYTNAGADGITEIDSSGNIVWEWNFFDHGIQDIDAGKPNYVGTGKTIADYPGRLNLNLPGWPLNQDWIHADSLDYNADLDQLVISSRWGEFYVIDHGHTFIANDPDGSIALASGSAGDFLYRFGDPAKYQQGQPPAVLTDTLSSTTGHRQMGGNHQVQWIAPGLPGAGHFLSFVNGDFLFEKTPQSYILEIDPYLDAAGTSAGYYINPPDAGYNLLINPNPVITDKQPKLISRQIVWTYGAPDNNGFFCLIGGGVQRLPNGNTLICSETEGHIFEVTASGEVVWEYIMPFTQQRGIVQWKKPGPPDDNYVYRAYRVWLQDPALTGYHPAAQDTLTGKTPIYFSPPALSNMTQTPQSPDSANPVWITVRTSEPANIKQIQLVYYTSNSVVPSLLTMLDDGGHQDGLANDGVYGAQIPAFPAGTIVRYYVQATNPSDVPATAPSDAPILSAGATGSMYAYTVSPSDGLTGGLLVTPGAGLSLNLIASQPATLTSQTYVLTNSGNSSITWTATSDINWITLSPISGTLDAGTPVNITASYNANISTLPCGLYAGTITISNATSGAGNTMRVWLLTVQSELTQPQLISPGDQTVDEDSVLTFPLQVINPDCDTIVYSMAGTPTGGTLDPMSGVFSWHPNYNQAGSHLVTFTASASLSSDARTINIVVNNVNNPDQTNSPSPAVEAINVPATTTLSWLSSAYVTSFDVYLGANASNIARVASGITETHYAPPATLSYSTTYYWRIDAHNISGQLVAGDIWSFTTMSQPLPDQATSPVPANEANNIAITQLLSWMPATYADAYDVYIQSSEIGVGSTPVTNTPLTHYAPNSPLQYSTLYYWRVDSKNAVGLNPGNIWSFTTQPPQVTLPDKTTTPNPANNANNVSINQLLSWNAVSNADSYDVYFGATTNGWTPITNTVLMSFSPSILSYSTIYYWRVDARNTLGAITGDMWSFTTQAQPATPPAKATNPMPDNNAANVPITITLTWSAANGADAYDIYVGSTTTNLTLITTTILTSLVPSSEVYSGTVLSVNTQYYWRVDSKNSIGTTTGDMWSFTTQSNQTSGGSSGGTESSSKKCGLMGAEALIAIGLIWLLRRNVHQPKKEIKL